MKYKKIISVLTATLCSVAMIKPIEPVAEEKNALTDSGIDYTETTETTNNPGAGYTSTLW